MTTGRKMVEFPDGPKPVVLPTIPPILSPTSPSLQALTTTVNQLIVRQNAIVVAMDVVYTLLEECGFIVRTPS